MLTNYIQAAMKQAKYEIFPDDGTFYGAIPICEGVYANAVTLEACREELQEVLEDWILLSLTLNLPLPVLDNIDLTITKAERRDREMDSGEFTGIPAQQVFDKKRGKELYENVIRAQVEIPENIGKIVSINVETGEYEIGEDLVVTSGKLQAKQANAIIWAERIGFDAVYAVGGTLIRTAE